MSTLFRQIFMERVVRGLVEKEMPKYTVPCEESPSGKRLVEPDVSAKVLADIRTHLIGRAIEFQVPLKRSERLFREEVVPVYHELAPKIFAEV